MKRDDIREEKEDTEDIENNRSGERAAPQLPLLFRGSVVWQGREKTEITPLGNFSHKNASPMSETSYTSQKPSHF